MNELDYRVAIEALENHVAQTRPIYETAKAIDYLKKAHQEALAKQEGQSNFLTQCEALASELKAIKQEQGEPVAWLGEGDMKAMTDLEKQSWIQAGRSELVETYNKPLYITTQSAHKSWIGLEIEELKFCTKLENTNSQAELDLGKAFWSGARWAEAKLKKKNVMSPQPAQNPLTDEEIVAINDKHYNIAYRDFDADIAIARAIEAAHGIKENT